MSLDWGVIPVDPENVELCVWLREHGIDPPATGRFPTLVQLRAALAQLGAAPLREEQRNETLWSISAGEPQTAVYVQLLGTVEADGRYDFHFFGLSNEELTMLRLLRLLAAMCGPLICYDSMTATPVLVTAATDVPAALTDWEARRRARR